MYYFFDFLLGILLIIGLIVLIATIFVLLTPLLITVSIGLGIIALTGVIIELCSAKNLRKKSK